jgi:hypothetical protein
MPKRKNIGRRGADFAAETQRQFNELRGALHTARQNLNQLGRMITPVKIRSPRGRTPTVRTNNRRYPPAFNAG